MKCIALIDLINVCVRNAAGNKLSCADQREPDDTPATQLTKHRSALQACSDPESDIIFKECGQITKNVCTLRGPFLREL